ncbi:tetratricopeptide repeat protein [Vreelandella subglaciescola]|jgi:predicted Zn-dependent protease|uniref:Tetratricopeptide repeat-containing protein n=1 Tax=Vreelandella subglaciescola TaxID=29571 RepID=A0A1M7IK36_9GAMM|nr:tetratricopeptide repeat protein [Halomonas subglaciescola]SHM40747.1 Tetratricopeptide repeat-containing protein [Halomonas subglaciescola]
MPLRATFIRATLLTRTPRYLTLPAIAVAAFLSGCQSVPPSADAFGAPNDDILQSAPPITQGLDADGLSTLLAAELAGQRGLYRYASQGYLDAAERYPDPALAERATFAARFGESATLLQTAAARWQVLDPANATPGRLLSAIAQERGDWQTSLAQRLTIAAQGDNAGLAALAEQAIIEGAAPAALIQQLETALAADNAMPAANRGDAHLAAALLEKARGNTDAAQAHLAKAQTLTPDSSALWRTQAHLALENGDYRDARQAAREGLKRDPDDARFALLLTQAEIRLDNIAAAEAQTNALLERHTGGPELRLALARLYLEEGQPGAAKRLLHPLASRENVSAMGYYLLGEADRGTGDVDSALLYYRQVEGDEFIAARAAAAGMLIDAERLTDARAFLQAERMRFEDHFNELVMLEVELLDERGQNADASALIQRELARTPDDTTLLYMRAMRAWQAGNIPGMEQDLQRVLKHAPDNVMALNALGYTLADEKVPGRLEDARELIERAHALAPDNPAVLDSLGWVYFRLGRTQDAQEPLERAYNGMPDQEVTAHLAEVLNALGQRKRARRLLSDVLDNTDRHPAIDDLLRRHPELSPISRD